MACCSAIQHELLRGIATSEDPRATGRLGIDRAALRGALGGRAEIVERMEAKARGRPGVNVGATWRFLTAALYQSGDLPVLATREAAQNSLDSNRAAIRTRKTRKKDAVFAVTWDPAARSLTWEDSGIGMSADEILGKFLTIGESGKEDAASSAEAAGGFGVAKAVILGCSSTFSWEVHTRDNLAISKGADQDVEVFEAPFYLQGARITVHDVPEDFDLVWDYARQQHVPLLDRLHELLAANDLPGTQLLLNGVEVKPLFSRRGGSKVRLDGSWGAGTEAAVKAYRRPPGDRQGGYFVRLNGLFQFKRSAQRGNLKADVVVDLTTTVRPGQRGYPLNAARDGLQDRARWAFADLVEEVERENESVGRSLDDEVFDPDSDDAGERDGARQLAELAAEAFADEGFQRALAEATGGIADFYAERVKDPGVQTPVDSTAPAGSKAGRDGPTRTMVLPEGMELAAGASPVQAETATPAEAAGQLRGMLEAAAGVGKDSGEPVRLPSKVERVLQRAEAGHELDADAVAVLDRAITTGAETALGPAGGGLLQAVAVSQAAHSVLDWLPADEGGQQRKKRKRNPFGRMAGLRISRKNYDRRRAGRFKRGFARWIPHLTAWDATLRLVAGEARIRRRFKPGFVLDDELLGLASSTATGGGVIYIHPDRLAQVVKAHKQRPLAIAAYLHGIACHELTHVDGRMGQGHSEEFVSAREDLGHATGHLLPAIAVMVTKLLGLKLMPTAEQKRIGGLERQLERARAATKKGKGATAKATKLAAALEQARAELAEALAESAEVRASCCSCSSCAPGRQPAAWATPGTRLRGRTLGQWLDGWETLQARPPSAARHAALGHHLAALPDGVVEQAGAEELDALDVVLRAARPPRGQRAGHVSTRLLDAIDRRRQQLATPATGDAAERVLDAATAVLRARPPAGVDVDYLDAFVRRHRDHLQGLVRGALERRAAGGAR